MPLNPTVFDGKHGTILDSGTTYAYLPEAAFVSFKDAIMKELHSLKPIRGPDPNYNDICFSGAGSDISQLSSSFPAVEMVFGNGQKLLLSPENYLFRELLSGILLSCMIVKIQRLVFGRLIVRSYGKDLM